MNISSWLSTITIAGVLALPIVALGDYVADDSEIAAMKAKILKNPPTAETLTAPPYPGSKLDAECSADQSATNQADPMVYCLYTKDSLDKVKAYLAGPGKPAAWVSVFADTDDVAVQRSGDGRRRYTGPILRQREAQGRGAGGRGEPTPGPSRGGSGCALPDDGEWRDRIDRGSHPDRCACGEERRHADRGEGGGSGEQAEGTVRSLTSGPRRCPRQSQVKSCSPTARHCGGKPCARQ